MVDILERKRSERSKAATMRAQQASKLCWQLAISGIVIAWLFKEETQFPHLTVILFWAVVLFAIAVIVQVGYNILSSIIMLRYAWDKLTVIDAAGNEVPSIIPEKTIKMLWRIWLMSFPFAFAGYIMLGIVLFNILV